MSIFIKKDINEERPADAILLRKDQISGFYELVVQSWQPQRDIWALSYGPKMLGVAGALSGMYGTQYFRRKLRLTQKNYGAISMYLPNLILPFLLTQSMHMLFVTNDIYANPLGCSLCKETRAVAIQVGFGLVQPLILVPASAFMFATRHFTFRLPSPLKNTKDFLNVCKQLYRPLRVPMTINVGLQAALAIFITHMEENHFLHLEKAIVQSENVVESLPA